MEIQKLPFLLKTRELWEAWKKLNRSKVVDMAWKSQIVSKIDIKTRETFNQMPFNPELLASEQKGAVVLA